MRMRDNRMSSSFEEPTSDLLINYFRGSRIHISESPQQVLQSIITRRCRRTQSTLEQSKSDDLRTQAIHHPDEIALDYGADMFLSALSVLTAMLPNFLLLPHDCSSRYLVLQRLRASGSR